MSKRPRPSPDTAHRLVNEAGQVVSDSPWIFRTYAGHTSARASNELFLHNLAAGQTGLSIAFDLPTQCGYSSDEDIARPEVGKVGVPINSIDDMAVLMEGIPLAEMNTSMTINGTAMWLLALYLGLARERGVPFESLRGTTQNDIIKEYLARGTYIFPPAASMRLIAETYEYCLVHVPKWNPSNVCSYHLQEAGATPAQELAFALVTAIGVLDTIRDRAIVTGADFHRCVGRISFFVNAGIRFVEEVCKMRAFARLWDEIAANRYAVDEAELRRFRYGVQVNSLGLSERQPENNAWRILIESLGVLLSRDARCRALQLPAWNEALSLPRPWDQQWSLRLQQILAFETDLLAYPDIFEGSLVIESKVDELMRSARAEIERIDEMGGVRAAIDNGYMKSALVASMVERTARIAAGDQVVVGVNRFEDGLPSPLVAGEDAGRFRVDPTAAADALASLVATRQRRSPERVAAALAELERAARDGDNMMEASIECALARVTTGEWAGALRKIFGDYRASTGIEGQTIALDDERLERVQHRVQAFVERSGRRPRLLVGKPGLDGHSNGAEMVAVAAKSAGFDVVYAGIRLSAQALVASAVEEDVDIVGVSILSGSHLEIADQLLQGLASAGAGAVPVIVGGIISPEDADVLLERGVRRVFTPSDYRLIELVEALVDLLEPNA